MKKTALITGASSGLGLEFSKIFAREGYDLIIVARSIDKLNALRDELAQAYQTKVSVISLDLTAPNAAQSLYDQLVEQPIDVLINNAGFGDYGVFSEIEMQRLTDMIQLNITALTQLTRLYLPEMLKRGEGRILNIASIASFAPGPRMAMYYATKAFVLSLTESIAEEIRGTDVHISALCPGPTETQFFQTARLARTSVITSIKKASAKDVAEYGFRALMRGNVVAVPGLLNKIACLTAQLLPRALVRRCTGIIQK